MTCLPDEVYTDPHVVACTRRAARGHGGAPPVPEPPREMREMVLAALGGNGQNSWGRP
jgi:hypothetical protein